jgi:hypothetical protein
MFHEKKRRSTEVCPLTAFLWTLRGGHGRTPELLRAP